MERIELFDKYISGEMSESEVADFKRKLSENKELSSDFQIYKMVVKGIYKEEAAKAKYQQISPSSFAKCSKSGS